MTRVDCENNRNFFAEILKDLKEPAKILAVYYAKPKEEWDEVFGRNKISFSENCNRKKFELIVADENLDKFVEQAKIVDAIYFHGGNQDVLKEKMANVENLKEIFEGKTIAGSSAGVHFLSVFNYSIDSNKIEEGLRVLPFKFFTHYKDEMKNELEGLKKHGDENMKTYAIPETEFIVLNN